LMAALISPK